MDFEEQFSQALRNAGKKYDIEAQPLLALGIRRGRVLRGRRIAGNAAGGVLAVALIAAGTAALASGPPDGARPVADVTWSKNSISGAQVADLLESMLPAGRTTQARGVGVGGGRPTTTGLYAQVIFDDGHGAAQVQIQVVPAGSEAGLGTTCPKDLAPGVTCQQTELPNGSRVEFAKSPFGGKDLLWRTILETRSGDLVSLSESNTLTAGQPSSPITRATPPLSFAQMSDIVENGIWSRALAVVHAAKSYGQPSSAQILAIAKQLQPAGVRFGGTPSAGQEGQAVVSVGPRTSLTIEVQHWPGQSRSEVTAPEFASAAKLPDGTLITTNEINDSGPINMLFWRVDVLRPDGTLVGLILQSNSQGTGPAHAELSMAQLKAIAMSPKWVR